jgi:hypothetical protein
MKQANILVNSVQTEVSKNHFKENTRKSPRDFTRNRKLSFEELIYFVLQSPKTTISTGVRRFFKELERSESMMQLSVSEAKAKLKWEGFEYLFRTSTVKPLVQLNQETWNDYFIYAVDGSRIALPMDKKLLSYYGAVGRGAKSPTAQASILYDVLNDIIVDAAIVPVKIGERKLAFDHIDVLKTINEDKKKLVIFDRGYPSWKLIDRLESNGLSYVMRVQRTFNVSVDAQTKADGVVQLNTGDAIHQLRVLKIKLDGGITETLITNIHDEALSVDDFKKLYFMRWPIETKYNIIKNKLELENFTSRTVDGIKIDFFAMMFVTNLMASVEHDVKAEIESEREDKSNKYTYRVNKNELIGVLKDYFIVAVAHDCPDKQKEAIDKILTEAQRNVVPIRPNRSVERPSKARASKFHHNQKSNV